MRTLSLCLIAVAAHAGSPTCYGSMHGGSCFVVFGGDNGGDMAQKQESRPKGRLSKDLIRGLSGCGDRI